MHPQGKTWWAVVLVTAPLSSQHSLWRAAYWPAWQPPAPPSTPQLLPAFLPYRVCPLLCQIRAGLQPSADASWGVPSQARPFPKPSVMKSSLKELTSVKGGACVYRMCQVTGYGSHPENFSAPSVLSPQPGHLCPRQITTRHNKIKIRGCTLHGDTRDLVELLHSYSTFND